jgi:hypothetical protein
MNEQQQRITKQLGYIRQTLSNSLKAVEQQKHEDGQEFDDLDAYIVAMQASITTLVVAESDIVARFA